MTYTGVVCALLQRAAIQVLPVIGAVSSTASVLSPDAAFFDASTSPCATMSR